MLVMLLYAANGSREGGEGKESGFNDQCVSLNFNAQMTQPT
jgi:hypothetical protein